jgi:TBC1 domain family member 8/9
MCKTFYDLFADESNEQELFHAIAAVATLLLQIGEVGKQFRFGDDVQNVSNYSSSFDSYWTITFEQLLASMLTESSLVNYFERQNDLTPAVARFRSRRLLRQTSSSPSV